MVEGFYFFFMYFFVCQSTILTLVRLIILNNQLLIIGDGTVNSCNAKCMYYLFFTCSIATKVEDTLHFRFFKVSLLFLIMVSTCTH